MLLEIIEPSLLLKWIAAHASGSLRATATDSWEAYLVANGATGAGLHDLESSWLAAVPQSSPGATLADQWSNFTAAQAPAGGTMADRVRTYFSS